jgi:hypothetical protein
MDFLDLLKGQLSDDAIDGLSRHTGINDSAKTKNATNAILAFLTKALANNTSSANGAGALMGALDRDHDGSVLDDVMGLLTGAVGGGYNSKTLNGIGILGHILGARQNFVVEAIAKMVGLQKNQTAMLMIRLAPLVLGMLGKKKKENNLNERGLSDLLSNTITHRENNDQGILSRILDRDKDGSAMDEIAKMGMSVLGNFLFR